MIKNMNIIDRKDNVCAMLREQEAKSIWESIDLGQHARIAPADMSLNFLL